MIIDLHRHMWSVGDRHRVAFSEIPGRSMPPPITFDWEETSREIVSEMDEAGVDKSVLLLADFAARLGEPPFSVHEENLFIVEAQRRYPNKIISYYGIDPRRPGAAESFERAITEWNVTGIKLHPTVGYFPHERFCYPIYEICASHEIPVLFHVGPAFHPKLYSRYSHPLEYDQVAADFPNMTMIMGHAGGEWWHDCIAVAHGHPNMILELSEWQVILRDRPQEALGAIDRMRNSLGIERIVWGTDFPDIRREMSLKACVEIFSSIPTIGKEYGYEFSTGDAEAILGENAARILKLT